MPTIDRARTTHVVTVRGLTPNTQYYALVTAAGTVGGKRSKAWYGFRTSAPGSALATVTSRENTLLLNGQPTILTMSWIFDACPDPQTLASLTSLRVDAVRSQNDGNGGFPWQGCAGSPPAAATWATTLHQALSGRLWWYENSSPEATLLTDQRLPELLSWHAQTTSIKSGVGHVGPDDSGFLFNKCPSLAELDRNARSNVSRPLLYAISLGTHSESPAWETCETPASIAAQFWMIVTSRGSVMWDVRNAGNTFFNLLAGGEAEAAKLATQRSTLSPVILFGNRVPLPTDSNSDVRFGAWKYGGAYYVQGVNTTKRSVSASFGTGLQSPGSKAEVLFEHRNVRARAGSVNDVYGPFGTHWYRLTAAP